MHTAFGRRLIIKPYIIRLHMEDSFRTQMLFLQYLLIEMLGLFFFNLPDLDGVSRSLQGEISLF